MICIAHRGNINGRNVEKENRPEYILNALEQGYDVEIDIRHHNGRIYLGHSEPQYKIDKEFLKADGLWIHCKNIEAVEQMLKWNENVNWFWHEKDKVTITKHGYVWCFPGNECDGGIMVEFGQDTDKEIIGVCSDNIERWKKR
tara:strand:+ start:328 stop:756 length:429 start_codon:yes stop_codon:yes gene_type:complete